MSSYQSRWIVDQLIQAKATAANVMRVQFRSQNQWLVAGNRYSRSDISCWILFTRFRTGPLRRTLWNLQIEFKTIQFKTIHMLALVPCQTVQLTKYSGTSVGRIGNDETPTASMPFRDCVWSNQLPHNRCYFGPIRSLAASLFYHWTTVFTLTDSRRRGNSS